MRREAKEIETIILFGIFDDSASQPPHTQKSTSSQSETEIE